MADSIFIKEWHSNAIICTDGVVFAFFLGWVGVLKEYGIFGKKSRNVSSLGLPHPGEGLLDWRVAALWIFLFDLIVLNLRSSKSIRLNG